MELVSKRIWGFPLMDRKCNTEELSSTRTKTIVFQFIFVFKFCLPGRLLTFTVSSHPATLLPWVPKVFSQPNMVRLSGEARSATMMCHGFVRSLILVLLCLETVSFGIISNTDGYVLISGKSQTAFPGKKIKYLIDRKTAIYHATIQHLLALFRKQCPLVAQA